MNKLVEEAPYHPGYEDAVVSPAPKYKGVDPAKMIWKEKQHKYDPETGEPLIDGYPLFSGLPRPQTKPLSDEEIIAVGNAVVNHIDSNEGWIEFARAIEERHRIK